MTTSPYSKVAEISVTCVHIGETANCSKIKLEGFKQAFGADFLNIAIVTNTFSRILKRDNNKIRTPKHSFFYIQYFITIR